MFRIFGRPFEAVRADYRVSRRDEWISTGRVDPPRGYLPANFAAGFWWYLSVLFGADVCGICRRRFSRIPDVRLVLFWKISGARRHGWISEGRVRLRFAPRGPVVIRELFSEVFVT